MIDDKTDRPSAPSSNGNSGIKRRDLWLGSASVFGLSTASVASTQAAAATTPDGSVLPRPEPPFHGRMTRTVKESTPDFPKGVEAPAGSPNVLLILTDDVGFGAASTFGGPMPRSWTRQHDSGASAHAGRSGPTGRSYRIEWKLRHLAA